MYNPAWDITMTYKQHSMLLPHIMSKNHGNMIIIFTSISPASCAAARHSGSEAGGRFRGDLSAHDSFISERNQHLLPLITGKSKKKDKCKNSQMYPLSETQYCPCDKYNAQPVGNWSDCILPEDRVENAAGMKVQGDMKECGQGYRYQAMVCYDQDNRLVETSRCNSHGTMFIMWLWA